MKNGLSGRSVWLAVALLATGCGGGGSITAPFPHPIPSPSSGSTMSAIFKVLIPAVAPVQPLSASRRPRDFSASTQSVSIAIGSTTLAVADVSATSTLCTAAPAGRTCSIGVTAPLGADTFVITAYDQKSGGGSALASGLVQATIATGPVATFDVAVTGKIATLRIALTNAYPPAGTPADTQIVVNGLDADGNVVLGTYANPITLSDADGSGATALSVTSLPSASASAMLHYNGATPSGLATISASLPGAASVSTSFAPAPAYVANYPLQRGPRFQVGVGDIALGADGNMWVEGTSYAEMIKFLPDGTSTTYPLPSVSSFPVGLVLGTNGQLWFAEQGNNAIGEISTAGTITEFPVPGASPQLQGVALGKDGNIWFLDEGDDTIDKITTTGSVTAYPLDPNAFANGLASGPDGNLWVTDAGQNAIVVISTAGTLLATYPIPTPGAQPYGINAGNDGNVWFSEFNVGKVARITPGGAISEFLTPSGNGDGVLTVIPGPDGAIWYSEMSGLVGVGKIGRLAVDGSNDRDFPNPTGMHVRGLAFDKNGTLWFTATTIPGADAVGKLVY